MDILGQVVLHKTFGNGRIVGIDDELIIVSFSIGDKKFKFPEAFGAFLTASDQAFAEYSSSLKNEKERQVAENEAKHIQEMAVKRAAQEQAIANKREKNVKGHKKIERANIAFKCNYCDGGKSNKQVGFEGVCSDLIIRNNISIEHRTWCSSDDCPCSEYFDGDMTREELIEMCENDGFVCYESQMLREWRAFAGVVQTGERKGEPMKLHQVENNSLCVLTTRNPGSTESERYIFAVFLVDDIFEGDNQDEGFVTTSSKYKLKLTPNEAQKMLFWNYHANGNNPKVPAWNSGLHRYIGDRVAAQILRDIVEIKSKKEDCAFAQEFLDHFCTVNGVSEIGKSCGALNL